MTQRTIARGDVTWRWQHIWPYAGVEYSMDDLWQSAEPGEEVDFRQDCSGAVCMSVDLAAGTPGSWGGLNTVSMVTSGLWVRLGSWDDLAEGDAVGIMGEGTGGANGHVMGFEAWYNDNPNDSRAWIWEQAGGTWGPIRRLVDLAAAAGRGYRPYRCTFVTDGGSSPSPTPPGGGAELRRAWPSYMPSTEWFGDIKGPSASHGGYYASERPDVAAIQTRLYQLGYAEVGPADGIFGPKTVAAVSRWQREQYAPTTSYYGQVWWDDWSHLFTY
jgi:hypothetical protein